MVIFRERERERAYGSDELDVELVGAEEHVGAGVTVEHELALAVVAQSDKGEGGAGALVKVDAAAIDAVLFEDPGEHTAELVVSELSDEGSLPAEPGNGDRHVGRGPAGRLDEARRLRQRHPRHRRHEVYQHLPETDNQPAPRLRHSIAQRRSHHTLILIYS